MSVRILIYSVIIITMTSHCNAQWVRWSCADGGNNHWYRAVHTPSGITWNNARQAALAQGADLVTISSAEENNFVFSLVTDLKYWENISGDRSRGPWLGGYQLPGSSQPAGGWTWVTGEPFTYTNWVPGQPDNSGGNQDRVRYWSMNGHNSTSSQWDDNHPSSPARGYIIERATMPEPTVTAKVHHNTWGGGTGGTDSGKSVVREGGGHHLLTIENLTNSAMGINGLVFDIQSLADTCNLSIEDFEFQVSPQGAFNAGEHLPSSWQAAPPPSSISVTVGPPDRVLFEWPDQSIMNCWLRITIKANPRTGLTQPAVYYIGHLLGETTGPDNGMFTVSFADITPIRAEVGQTVDASSITDIDKSGTVSFADISAMRGNVGAQLTQISVP